MVKSVDSEALKYPRSRSKGHLDMITIEDDWELQYDENHNVVKVKVGKTDLIKEVASHKDEVGLTNAIKNAIAHGEDPLTKFGKYGPGVTSSIPLNSTLDDVKQYVDSIESKYDEIAKGLGITSAELKEALSKGTLAEVIKAASEPESVEKGDE